MEEGGGKEKRKEGRKGRKEGKSGHGSDITEVNQLPEVKVTGVLILEKFCPHLERILTKKYKA